MADTGCQGEEGEGRPTPTFLITQLPLPGSCFTSQPCWGPETTAGGKGTRETGWGELWGLALEKP